MKNYKFADLFCGVGGISSGLEKSGFKLNLASDVWDVAIQNIKNNFKNVDTYQLNFFDKKNQRFIENKIKEANIQIVAGGPPCQGFSSLGKRKILDERNSLVDIFLNIIKNTLPQFLIIENVRGLKTMRHRSGKFYIEHIREYLNQDYLVKEIILDGIKLGMSQTRKRIFFIGIKKLNLKNILRNSIDIDTVIERISKDNRKKEKSLRDTIYDLYVIDKNKENEKVHNHQVFDHGKDVIERIKNVPPGGGLQDIPDCYLNDHLKRMKSGYYGSGGFVKNVYGRLEWDKPSGTIIAGIRKITCGRLFHPESDRLLTVRECARLQTFDDKFQLYGSFNNQYTLVGNAVPPLFAKICGDIIKTIIKSNFFIR